LCLPGGASKATLVDCAWLVDPHLVLVVGTRLWVRRVMPISA
jgi:hypothetical protein